jgi:predicted RNA binding protein YcfA (HicA-like mRNA interferase family)
MPALPLLRPQEVVRAFQHLGWQVASTWQSHYFDEAGRFSTLSVPDHPMVARGALRALIAKAGLTVGEFLAAVE